MELELVGSDLGFCDGHGVSVHMGGAWIYYLDFGDVGLVRLDLGVRVWFWMWFGDVIKKISISWGSPPLMTSPYLIENQTPTQNPGSKSMHHSSPIDTT